MADEDEIKSPKTGSKMKSGLLVYAGAFFLSYLITCTIIFFLLKNKYKGMYPAETAPADSAALAAADSSDTTKIAIGDSAAILLTDSLAALLDTSQVIDTTAAAAPPPAETIAARPDTVEDTTLTAEGLRITPEDSAGAEEQKKRVARLVRIVDKMKPADAASIFSKLDDEFVLQILMRMKERNAAKVLTEMPASRAAKLSSMITNKASG